MSISFFRSLDLELKKQRDLEIQKVVYQQEFWRMRLTDMDFVACKFISMRARIISDEMLGIFSSIEVKARLNPCRALCRPLAKPFMSLLRVYTYNQANLAGHLVGGHIFIFWTEIVLTIALRTLSRENGEV